LAASAIEQSFKCAVPACCQGLHRDAVPWAPCEVMEAEVQLTEPEMTEKQTNKQTSKKKKVFLEVGNFFAFIRYQAQIKSTRIF